LDAGSTPASSTNKNNIKKSFSTNQCESKVTQDEMSSITKITDDPEKGKEYRKVTIRGIDMGSWPVSELRHHIEIIDNAI
jgi:hypothetical protein